MHIKESEALHLLQEECAEVIQIISKIFRFGKESYHPNDPDRGNNNHMLHVEVADVLTIVEYLIETGTLDRETLNELQIKKIEKLKRFSSLYN